MRIAIVGFGGVGRALIKLLYDKKDYLNKEDLDIKVNYIINSSGGIYNKEEIDCLEIIKFLERKKDIKKYNKLWSSSVTFEDIIKNKDVDAIIEMTPTNIKTGEPGITHIKKSLERGIHVITANKGPIVLAYNELKKLVDKNKVQLCIGCTTGGALPSINGGIIDMAGAEILSIEGVLNGTTNFIINEMEEKGVEYREALEIAQKLGIAETDPTLDVEGWDTASKLLILTNVLMNEQKTLNDVRVEGITKITAEEIKKALTEGKKYKLLGRTIRKNNEIYISVKPEILDSRHVLYGVEGKNKGVRYTSDTLGDLTILGGASGVIPAAASILRDLINLNRGYKLNNIIK